MTRNLLYLLFIGITLFGCKKDSTTSRDQPGITTTTATNITSTSAVSGGVITNNGDLTVIASGLCWANTQDPTILNTHTIDTTVIGTFTNNILSLLPANTYYVRAYIRTISDTLYGNQITITTPDMHIYIAGYERIGTKYVAEFWKDGTSPTALTNGTQDAAALSVYAVGSDVYVAGYESNGTKNVAKIWKNGVATNLTNGTNDAYANSVVVENNIVYVAGSESNGTTNVAKIWKNGVATNLTDGTYDAGATALTVTNNNVYVAGFESDVAAGTQAKLWVNGVASTMTQSSYATYASAVFVSGTDVYIAGYESSSFANLWVKLWKNGQEMNIDQGNFFFGRGTGVSVFGNDVHLVGITNDSGAAWWKNGSATALTNTYQSKAYAVQVSGGTAYIVGTKRSLSGYEIATFWVDNVATTLPHTGLSSYTTAIFVQ